MRGLLTVLAFGGTGCQLVFSVEGAPADAPTDAPQPNRPFGCSPASLLTDTFADMGQLTRPWEVRTTTTATLTENGDGLGIDVFAGTAEAIAEPYLELREHEFSVIAQHTSGSLQPADRATLDLRTEDGRHRLSYGLVVNPERKFDLVAEYLTFDDEGRATKTAIGSRPHTGEADAVQLVIRHAGEVTTFLAAGGNETPAPTFSTDLAPLDWIGYMRPILSTTATEANSFLFRNFNGGGVPAGEACPASTIHEAFDPLSTEWQRVTQNNACAIAEDASGTLHMNFTAVDEVHDCTIHTSTVYDLREHQVELELEEVLPGQASFMTVDFEIETRTTRARVRLDVPGSKLQASYDRTGTLTSVGDLPLDLAAITRDYPVWRIAGTADDRLRFEVGDGRTFQSLGATQLNDVGALDVVRIKVIAHASGNGAGAGVSLGEIRSQ